MNSIVEQCIASINDIKNTDFETEMDICESVIESYSKTLHLLEYYRDADVASLDILECEPLRVLITEAEQPQSVTPAPANNQQQQQTATENTQASNASTNATEEKKDEKKDDEKLWQADFRKTKDDGKKEHIIISILAFIPRLLWAIITFIGRWIKSLFKGKEKTKASEQKISSAINETGNPEEAATAVNTWLKIRQEELAVKMDLTTATPYQLIIHPNAKGKGTDANGNSIVLIYPACDLRQVLDILKLNHSNCITKSLELFKEFKSGKIDNINTLDAEIESIKKSTDTINSSIVVAENLIKLQNSQKRPDVSSNNASTANFAITYDQADALVEETSKLYQVMENDVKEMNEIVKTLQTSATQNGNLTSINEAGMKKIKDYTEAIKTNIIQTQKYLNYGLGAVNGAQSTIADIDKALSDPKQRQTIFGWPFGNRTNNQNTTGVQPATDPVQQQTPTPAANSAPVAPTPATPAQQAATPSANPTPVQNPKENDRVIKRAMSNRPYKDQFKNSTALLGRKTYRVVKSDNQSFTGERVKLTDADATAFSRNYPGFEIQLEYNVDADAAQNNDIISE